jgi:sulfur carrier protein
MTIKLNGKAFLVNESESTILELLKKAHVEKPEMVSVQFNGEFVDKESFAATLLKEGDEVDFVYFMGGGVERTL